MKKNSIYTTLYNLSRAKFFNWSTSNLLKIAENRYKNQSQFFACLAAQFLAERLYFYLKYANLKSLTIGLAIGRAILKVRKIAVNLSKWSLWNELIIFLSC